MGRRRYVYSNSPVEMPTKQTTQESASRPAKRARIEFGKQVTFIVGAGKKECLVHENFLPKLEASPGLVVGAARETHQNEAFIVTLPKTSVKSFQVYANWLYKEKVVLERTATDENQDIWRCLFECRILGRLLKDRKFCNAVTDCALRISAHVENAEVKEPRVISDYPSQHVIEVFLAEFGKEDKFDQLIVDLYLYRGSTTGVARKTEHPEAGFLFHLAVAGVAAFKEGYRCNPEQKHRCHYHEHDTDTDKCT